MSPKAWKGIEPEGQLVIRWATPPVTITCGHCHRSIGRFRSYRAGDEVGIVSVDTKRGRLTPKREMRTDDPRYRLDGERGRYAHRTFAHFECPRCHRRYNRRLDRLGKLLWDARPREYALTS
jgi:hypothetical protein